MPASASPPWRARSRSSATPVVSARRREESVARFVRQERTSCIVSDESSSVASSSSGPSGEQRSISLAPHGDGTCAICRASVCAACWRGMMPPPVSPSEWTSAARAGSTLPASSSGATSSCASSSGVASSCANDERDDMLRGRRAHGERGTSWSASSTPGSSFADSSEPPSRGESSFRSSACGSGCVSARSANAAGSISPRSVRECLRARRSNSVVAGVLASAMERSSAAML
mmetsp:Transcript_36915/g.101876  ORF Transcript_36915/g.101876 Transcript_36915/m.101876 type:complete len:232 (-) Transcript_36915:108-803(-)